MLPACSASAPAGILSRPKPRPPPVSRPVPGRSESATCPCDLVTGILSQSRPRPPSVSRPVPASAPAGIPSGPWPLRVRCLPGDFPAGISSQSRPRPPPVSCPNPGLGPRRHLVRSLAAPSPLPAHVIWSPAPPPVPSCFLQQ